MLVTLPYSITINKKGSKFYINLNQYRNAHFHILNAAKISFKEHIQDQVRRLPKLNVIKLWYKVYPPSKRDIDTNNICSIADKFFCDALVEAGKLEDDNYRFLIDTRFSFGEVDKGNPRVEVEIEETQPMKIIFGKEEILAALTNYVTTHLGIPLGDTVAVELKAVADDSFEATLNMNMPMKPSNKPNTYRNTGSIDIPSTGSNTRQAVSEALQRVKTTAPEEEAKEQPQETAKPSLLGTKPQMNSKPIVAPETVAADPTPAPTSADTTAAIADAPAGTEANSEPVNKAEAEPEAQITSSPEDRNDLEQQKPVQTGIGGATSEPKPQVNSIFSFKNKS